MLNEKEKLNEKVFDKDVEQVPLRNGFGEGLVQAGDIKTRAGALIKKITRIIVITIFSITLLLVGIFYWFQWSERPTTTIYFTSTNAGQKCEGALEVLVQRQPNFLEGDLVKLSMTYTDKGTEKTIFTSSFGSLRYLSGYSELKGSKMPSISFLESDLLSSTSPMNFSQESTFSIEVAAQSFTKDEFESIGKCMEVNLEEVNYAIAYARQKEFKDIPNYPTRVAKIIYVDNRKLEKDPSLPLFSSVNDDGIFRYSWNPQVEGEPFLEVDEKGYLFYGGATLIGTVWNGVTVKPPTYMDLEYNRSYYYILSPTNKKGENIIEYVARIRSELGLDEQVLPKNEQGENILEYNARYVQAYRKKWGFAP